MNEAIAHLRREYSLKILDERSVDPSPYVQFKLWFEEALQSDVADPTAMVLATATAQGHPSARVVLLKGYGEQGFLFFTNYESRKAGELQRNPNAALLFYWGELERQVRIEGIVERATREESEQYFKTRPLESRLSAWASVQSEVVPDRETLERKVAELREKFPSGEVPLPPFWGGLRVKPHTFEFWQGRENRLHDRIRYTNRANVWSIERLSP